MSNRCAKCGTDLTYFHGDRHSCTQQFNAGAQPLAGSLTIHSAPCPACAAKDAETARLKADKCRNCGHLMVGSGYPVMCAHCTVPRTRYDAASAEVLAAEEKTARVTAKAKEAIGGLEARIAELEAEREGRNSLWQWGHCGNCNWPNSEDEGELLYPVRRDSRGYWRHYDGDRYLATCGATFQREFAYMEQRVAELEAERAAALAIVRQQTIDEAVRAMKNLHARACWELDSGYPDHPERRREEGLAYLAIIVTLEAMRKGPCRAAFAPVMGDQPKENSDGQI